MMDWTSAVRTGSGPLYMRIADAIERAVGNGTLVVGQRLPSQRTLAKALSIDLTTVTRAFLEARRRSLVDPRGHAGSYVSPPASRHQRQPDPAMISPPSEGIALPDLLRRTAGAVLGRTDASTLMSYQATGGGAADIEAAAKWLLPMLGAVPEARIVVTAGAQIALSTLLLGATAAGNVLLADQLTYPGLLKAAASLDRKVVGVAGDADGMLPDALEHAVDVTGAKVVYLNPTAQNPTGLTLGERRRQQLCDVAERRHLLIIEDDPCWLLVPGAPAPLASRLPGQVAYVSTLSKCISPTLQTAFVALPAAWQRDAVVETLSGLSLMGSPFMTALATQMILDGSATSTAQAVREEALDRASMARSLLPDHYLRACNGLHAWFDGITDEMRERLLLHAAQAGLQPRDAAMFSTPDAPSRHGVRISVPAQTCRADLRKALRRLDAAVWRAGA